MPDHPKHLSIADFSYPLPPDRIASAPLRERDDSKLLIADLGAGKEVYPDSLKPNSPPHDPATRHTFTQDHYRNLAVYLKEGSLLLFNDTRVVEARLLFQKTSGGNIEIFCLEPHEQYAGIASALGQTERVLWLCMVGGASKWKNGLILEKHLAIAEEKVTLQARYVEKRSGAVVIELSWTPGAYSFAEILHHAGAIPLPPYIKRKPDEQDLERYQTIYARHEGSVAAPTAGLHFTQRIFDRLAAKHIDTANLTLHVGAGTFKPVSTDTIGEHEMHAEVIEVNKALLQRIMHAEKGIIPVGTTSMRTVESLYWLGVKLTAEGQGMEARRDFNWTLDQWEVYDLNDDITVKESMNTLIGWMNEFEQATIVAKTRIIIAPGYRVKIATALITNFHQPQSTLLLLIAALMGDDWKKMYAYALDHEFRFLSYGDGCLIRMPTRGTAVTSPAETQQ